MSKKPVPHTFQNISELKYVNADHNSLRYRVIMRYIYQEYQRMRYWLKPEEIYAGVQEWNLLENYTLDMCQSDLEQLVQWKNLSPRHDGGRVATVEEYLRKKFQYFLTPYSIEIERMLEGLEKIRGYGGSLEPTLFDTIAECLNKIRLGTSEGSDDTLTAAEAHQLWSELIAAFTRLQKTSVDYIASLQTSRAEELMATEAFLAYKETLTEYLRNFVQALQRKAYRIEAQLQQMRPGLLQQFWEKVVAEELARPTLEEEFTGEQLLADMQESWDGLHRWFVGEAYGESELMLLEISTKETIARVVRSVLRIQERRRSGLSRRRELDYLARWFYRCQTPEEAHRLAAAVFGLFPARKLQGQDERTTESTTQSMWQEQPTVRPLRSRSRQRLERDDAPTEIVNHDRQKKEAKLKLFRQRQEELELLMRLTDRPVVKMSELGIVNGTTRLRLLYWIGRCLQAGRGHAFRTPEGIEVKLINPGVRNRVVLQCTDGQLEMPDYQLRVSWTGVDRGEAASRRGGGR
ncbi:TIGR02677 family protein [Paenibacillus sp. MZ04-78.2]|uniref:TIGR02677 family protein n=1 Tax=Paenibacillus sp. MZ04-78.2 TaxID=2962034 RepID=UPI0020B6BFB7|nr:TIGR02677 family protein [Paenibacillus sp. MZ04-78.2]MCP3776016.1 TIGR02677 family protein [Paenibacillus sp. MZ04-78.2]